MKMNFLLSKTTNSAMMHGLKSALEFSEQKINNNVIIVVPETKTVMAERFLLEHSKNGAFSNIYICSYNRLLAKLNTSAENKMLTRESGIYIIKRIIQELSDSFVCYKKASKFLGFAENIYDTIAQLKSSGVTPQEFAGVARKTKGALPSKMMDISLIYDAYEDFISGGMIDMSDSLSEIAKASLSSEFIKKSDIFVLGFDTVTEQMKKAVKSFVKTAKSVTVAASFMHPKLENAHIADNSEYEHYKSVADELNIKYEPVICNDKMNEDMEYIASHAFIYPTTSKKCNGHISFFAAQSIEKEMVCIAEEISKNVRNGARFRDFGVLFAENSSNYEHALKHVFNEYNIPYYIAKSYDFSKHPLFSLINHVLELSRLGFESEHMIALAKNPLLDYVCMSNHFENYILRTGVEYNGFKKSFISNDKNSNYIEEESQAEAVRKGLVSLLEQVLSAFDGEKTVEEYVHGLKNFFERIDIAKRLDKLCIEERELGENESAAVTEQVLIKLNENLDALLRFLGKNHTTPSELSGLLLSGLSSVEISIIPLSLDSVIAQTKTDGMLGVKKLFVVGASEGNFPTMFEDCGIIRDSEINGLEDIFKVKIEPTIKLINRRERFKAFETLLSFDNVSISYAKLNDNGEENSPSSFVVHIASLFDDYKIAGDVVIPLKQPQVDTFNGDISHIYTYDNVEKILSITAGKHKSNVINASFDKLSSLYEAIKDNSKLDFDRVFGDQKTQNTLHDTDIYFKNKRTSISELEKYFTCPFLHFAEYGLALKDRKQAKMKAANIGDILHKIAEKYVNLHIYDKVHDENAKIKIINDVLYEDENISRNNRVLIEILKKEAMRLLDAIELQLSLSAFKPKKTEVWFGEKGAYRQIELSHGIKVEGKIDRVDTWKNYYRVIDYKTGKIEESPENLYYGKKVQLLSYLEAIRKTKNNMLPVGALYFPVHSEWADSENQADKRYKNKGYLIKDEDIVVAMDSSLVNSNTSDFIPANFKKGTRKDDDRVFGAEGNLLTGEQFNNVLDYILELENNAVNEILAGNIDASPVYNGNFNDLPCKYCDYYGVCGFDKNTLNNARKMLKNIKIDNFVKGE